jgi:ketosteroid isomerase-like protein
MSQENVEVARRTVEALNRRDRTAWLETDVIRGREAVWDFYIEVLGAWRDGAFETVELIDAGDDKLVQQVRAEMQGKTSGALGVLDYWTVGTFRNGRVCRVEWFSDRAEALRAAGLRD